jgi:excisionase family DNA binding protein
LTLKAVRAVVGPCGEDLPPWNSFRTGDEAPSVEPVDELLTAAEVARRFRVEPKTVVRWAATGRLGFIRTPGGHHRFRRSAIDALLTDLASAVRPAYGAVPRAIPWMTGAEKGSRSSADQPEPLLGPSRRPRGPGR